MHFNIDGFGEQGWSFIAANPKLKPYSGEIMNLNGVSPGMDVDRLLIYYAMLVDRGSHLLEIDNIRERKTEAMRIAKLPKREEGIPEWVQEVIIGSLYVNRVKNRLLYVQYNNDWSLLVTLQDAYYKMLDEVSTGGSSKAKEAIAIKNQMDSLIEAMNKGPVTLEDREIVYMILEEESLGIRPEEHIKRYQESGTVFSEYA